MDTLRPTFLEFPYEGKSLCIGGQFLTFKRKFYEGKKTNFDRRIFVFVLPIRNKPRISGKIITSFKIERMSLNLLAIWPKHNIDMQIIYDGRKVQVWECVFQGLNIGKWSTGEHCDGFAVVKNVKTIVSKYSVPYRNTSFSVTLKEGCHLFDTMVFTFFTTANPSQCFPVLHFPIFRP